VSGTFVGGKYFTREGTDICKHEADILYGIMKARFASLLNSRLLDRQMHSHECVVFVQWNLSRLAAILILSRQVQDDLATTAEDDTLLRDPENIFIRAIGKAADYQGNYLYHDIRRNRFVRSGKAVGYNRRTGEMRTFAKRNKEHLASSRNDKTGSYFYTAYPNRESTVQVSNVICRGHFQDLSQYVWLGFDRTHQGVSSKSSVLPIPAKAFFTGVIQQGT
jgi:hypothetical protein